MPITKTIRKHDPITYAYTGEDVEHLFVGRVLRIEKTIERRNWSDTLDYSDHRDTDCTWALVWLGTHGIPPRVGHRVVAGPERYSWETPCDLTIGEQYAWIDCTNLFADRNSFRLTPVVDTFDMQLLHGGPEMIEGVAAWEAFHAARIRAELEAIRVRDEARAAVIAAEAAKKAARQAKRDEKLAAAKSVAEAALARIPAKGTRVTVGDFTGTVFWRGVASYYGKWNARAGVKDAKGNVQWIDADKF